ncbi:unnamed protein product [Linum trigynum]|uniref:Cyclopropane-fatty-acyl-phospholipid synthase n=1 Tax=Linum trigynum TaxID=586398 RepID=A0AAV2D0Q9_9ROSI
MAKWVESGARSLFITILGRSINTGSLTIVEDGTPIIFQGIDCDDENQLFKAISLKLHNPNFYWKVMTRNDIGLADAYIEGDFAVVDQDQGLLPLFLLLIANRDGNKSELNSNNRGWWTPASVISSANFLLRHVMRNNSLTQARRNISRHYDLSNEFFALFLDETMTYSSGIFKNEDDDDLKGAQLRKISSLIQKARIGNRQEVLEIGCGWGSFAIEVVKRTGCNYTGITLSLQQLQYAQAKVNEAGLQDHIQLLLCDYRQLPKTKKFDRIVSCEMIEHVGHEYMDEFFASCESVLAKDGLFVLQFISIPDERYDQYRQSSDFIKEYIFPGGCLPSFTRVIAAMNSSSRLCVEHVENIGSHYFYTLRCWRQNLMNHRSEILEMGFDEKFIRTWEYYFDYCAAGFKTYTLGDYQVVFSRPGNMVALGEPYKSFSSAYH